MAQEVQKVIQDPNNFAGWHIADELDQNSEQALSYEEFISPIVRAIQELSAKVDAQAAEIEALKAAK